MDSWLLSEPLTITSQRLHPADGFINRNDRGLRLSLNVSSLTSPDNHSALLLNILKQFAHNLTAGEPALVNKLISLRKNVAVCSL